MHLKHILKHTAADHLPTVTSETSEPTRLKRVESAKSFYFCEPGVIWL